MTAHEPRSDIRQARYHQKKKKGARHLAIKKIIKKKGPKA